jgi:hypothetical protein
MFNLQNRRKGIDEDRQYLNNRIAVRDKLLSREFKEIEESVRNLPCSRLTFPNPTVLNEMTLIVQPNSGMYRGGKFQFSITVPPEYNNAVSFLESALFIIGCVFSPRSSNALHEFGIRISTKKAQSA